MQEEESSMFPELFALDDESSCESTCSLTRSAGSIDTVDYDSLDQCLDAHSLARSIQSLKVPDTNKRQRVGIAPSDLRPMAFVRMNTRLGKPKPVTIRALLDSGGSETIVTKDLAKNLRTRTTSTNSTVWTTPGGKMVTNQKVKAQFTIPELHSDRLIEWNMHVTDNLGAYDMIIGRDIMTHLGIDVRFSTMEIEWDHRTMPFKKHDACFCR